MNKSMIPELRKAMMQVVRRAAEPGGAIDKEEFTISTARAEVTRELGLEEGSLDGEWKKLVKEEVNRALEAVQDGAKEAESSSSSSTASGPDALSKKTQVGESRGDGSESEMSSVYDAPPRARKRKSAGGDEGGKKLAGKKDEKGKKKVKKDPNEGLSPDEARVADLKRMVVACGVRKQWSKEFEDYPTAKSQISALQRLLKDLGMEGKPSIGKAKAIKEARELASELNDVKEFNAARGVSADGRPKRGARGKGSKSAQGSSGEDEDGPQTPREQGAADAVMAFLGGGDESD